LINERDGDHEASANSASAPATRTAVADDQAFTDIDFSDSAKS
jgi:hypothetical protein